MAETESKYFVSKFDIMISNSRLYEICVKFNTFVSLAMIWHSFSERIVNKTFEEVSRDWSYSKDYKMIPLRSQKAERFEKVLHFDSSYHIVSHNLWLVALVSLVRDHTLPGFVNINGRNSFTKLIIFLFFREPDLRQILQLHSLFYWFVHLRHPHCFRQQLQEGLRLLGFRQINSIC